MLVLAVESLLAVAKHSKVTADAFTGTNTDVGEGAVAPRTPTGVGEVYAERCPLGCWIVREGTGCCGVWTGTLEEGPADGNLGGIVSVWTCQTSSACSWESRKMSEQIIEYNDGLRTCCGETRARLVDVLPTTAT